MVHRYPIWDLSIVLRSLTGTPYEPLWSASLCILSCKVTFLVLITCARRISEIATLAVRSDLCMFHVDRVVLPLYPSFIPKVNMSFHRLQEIVLHNFCPNPTHPLQKYWHTLDVWRALHVFLKRTAALRKTESLFVSFLPASLGCKVTPSITGCWIRQTITKAYELRSLPNPVRVIAHSTWSAATTAAWGTQASLEEICRAATWTSPPFLRHYKLYIFASVEAAFERRVLKWVHTEGESPHQTGARL